MNRGLLPRARSAKETFARDISRLTRMKPECYPSKEFRRWKDAFSPQSYSAVIPEFALQPSQSLARQDPTHMRQIHRTGFSAVCAVGGWHRKSNLQVCQVVASFESSTLQKVIEQYFVERLIAGTEIDIVQQVPWSPISTHCRVFSQWLAAGTCRAGYPVDKCF